ncbi:MAG: GDSL-type esterase/lipase family protein [Bacteroidales bacterium]|nr:GDSL-type esterase/lipase family protein [Bacteroidales bacterium]
MNRLITGLLLLLLLSCSPLKEYQGQEEVTKWEPDIQKFEALDKTENYPDDAVLFAGSSSIRLWSTLATDISPYPVIQRGYGGAKLSDFAVYAERIFSPHSCRALVFFVANDITGSANDKSPEEVRKLFGMVYRTFRKYNPEAPVFYIGITPSRSRWQAWPDIDRCNEVMKQWSEKKKAVIFVQTDTAFLNGSGEPREELFRSDKLHLNDDGYAIWTRIIRGELERVLQ